MTQNRDEAPEEENAYVNIILITVLSRNCSLCFQTVSRREYGKPVELTALLQKASRQEVNTVVCHLKCGTSKFRPVYISVNRESEGKIT
jgi:hypothetical protein